MPLSFSSIHDGNSQVALIEGDRPYSYADLNQRVDRVAAGLLDGSADLAEERIALFMPASVDYASALHAIWRAGGTAVPLNVGSAAGELEHYLGSASVTRVVVAPAYRATLEELCKSLSIELLEIGELRGKKSVDFPALVPDRRAMILFTSGTSSKPKGVVSTHRTIHAQISTLLAAWEWSSEDVIPLFLPVHHVHGIINVLSCALAAGATVYLYKGFVAAEIAAQVAAGRFTLFMAVPTIYVKLTEYLEGIETAEAAKVIAGFAAMRLNVSGSAACPETLFRRWQALTGQVLLERYGMTEIGMALSNPYRGERRAGHVGQPLPGVQVSLFDEFDRPINAEGEPGEIRVRGDSVFLEYWNNPAATTQSFIDGWFATGDIAVLDEGYYRIMGRASIDIIKSGGYKLSALEIESVLLTHPAVAEVAVIGVEDATWGEAVVAVAVLRSGHALDYADLKVWCGPKMSPYKFPKALRVVDRLPRNAMGKVTKPALRSMLR